MTPPGIWPAYVGEGILSTSSTPYLLPEWSVWAQLSFLAALYSPALYINWASGHLINETWNDDLHLSTAIRVSRRYQLHTTTANTAVHPSISANIPHIHVHTDVSGTGHY